MRKKMTKNLPKVFFPWLSSGHFEFMRSLTHDPKLRHAKCRFGCSTFQTHSPMDGGCSHNTWAVRGTVSSLHASHTVRERVHSNGRCTQYARVTFTYTCPLWCVCLVYTSRHQSTSSAPTRLFCTVYATIPWPGLPMCEAKRTHPMYCMCVYSLWNSQNGISHDVFWGCGSNCALIQNGLTITPEKTPLVSFWSFFSAKKIFWSCKWFYMIYQ